MSLRAFRGYLAARLREKRRTESWRAYIADALRCAAENTARAFGGSWPARRWAELSGADDIAPADAAGTALGVLRRAGIEVR